MTCQYLAYFNSSLSTVDVTTGVPVSVVALLLGCFFFTRAFVELSLDCVAYVLRASAAAVLLQPKKKKDWRPPNTQAVTVAPTLRFADGRGSILEKSDFDNSGILIEDYW